MDGIGGLSAPFIGTIIIVTGGIILRALRRRARHGDAPRKRPVYVLGQGMAAARAAEAARLAGGPQRESPMPAELYGRTNEARSLLFLDENEIDRRLRSIAVDFASASDDERKRITASIDLDGLYALMLFANRSAVYALRQNDPQRCVDGMRAVAMIDLARIDGRDLGGPLMMLDKAALRIGVARDALFSEAERLASKDVSDEIRSYRRVNSPSASSLWEIVETRSGLGFVFRDTRPFRPEADLLAIALAISARLKAGRYLPDDPWIATDLPAAWFEAQERTRWKGHVNDAVGAVSFHAFLRPDVGPHPREQRLIVFLAEMPTAERAAALASAAEGPQKDGGAVLATSEGKLLLVVVGSAFQQGARSYETPDSVRELIETLRPLLRAS